MAVREVIRMGNPILYQAAEPVTEFNAPELDQLIQDMFDTMAELNGAGLAAPQIAISKQIMIFGIEHNPRYPDIESVPTTVLINPEITVLTEEMDEYWEGCLSVPGMRGLVPRFTHIKYIGFDQRGNKIEREAKEFHARVVQHEKDHLDGILYPMRIEDLQDFSFEDELIAASQRESTTD